MKNRKAAAYLGITLFVLASGCGQAEEKKPVPAAEANVSEEENETETVSDANWDGEDKPSEETDRTEDTVQGEQKQETLIGSVSSIGEDSLVISRSFEEEEGVLAAPAEGSPDEVLVSVQVLAHTQYEIKTVKNSGINGDSDVETKSGSFSDLEADASVDLSGYYEGEMFVAEKICIYRFV